MFSFGTANHENEPGRPISSAVFVRSVVLGADASNRLQHCGPGVFGRRDVSSEHCAGAHTDEGRVRNIRVVLFGVTFLTGLHNAALLEAYTIYGSGRYHRSFPAYAW